MKKYIEDDSCILTDEYVYYMESIFETLPLEEIKQFTKELTKSNRAQRKLLNEREKKNYLKF